jgi:glutathione S-transferase
MILYDLDHSPFAARIRIALRAKGLEAELRKPPDDFRRINPLGLVPTLVAEDGTVLIESETIVEYLEDRFPTPSLRPDAALDRAVARILARLCDLHLAPALKSLFEATKRPTDAAETSRLLADIRLALATIERYLANNDGFAVGDRLTTADCALAPLLFFVARCESLTPDTPLLGGAVLAEYWRRIQAHPAVAPVLAKMTLAQSRRAAARARGEAED